MDEQQLQQPLHHQIITKRFVEACQVDERVIAAFIGGSYARGANDSTRTLISDLLLLMRHRCSKETSSSVATKG